MAGWLRADTRARRLALALAVYVVATGVYFACASRTRITSHTPWNHFALLADAWLHHRLDLGAPPPSYSGNNDFASYQGKWYVVFPPFPALLLLPVVKLAGSVDRVQDGQFFLWLAGVAPATLFLGLEKLRRTGRSRRSVWDDLLLTVLFAFGTVYFFTAEQGTVWFAAHVVGTALAALYLLFALDAEKPILAGLMLGLGFMTRAPLIFAAPLFVLEAWRVSRRDGSDGAPLPNRIDLGRLASRLCAFAAPLMLVLGTAGWYNRLRFGHASEFGYRYLTVAWQARMEKWGVFSYHYLGKNLAVMLTDLPWWNDPPTPARMQINQHGLPLWMTTPLLLWLLWPRRREAPHVALWLAVIGVGVPGLFYQNTGWLQFGYRFSNDYAVFLFALLAIGDWRFGWWFRLLALWSVAINTFGALTFDRAPFTRFYYQDASQRIIHPPD